MQDFALQCVFALVLLNGDFLEPKNDVGSRANNARQAKCVPVSATLYRRRCPCHPILLDPVPEKSIENFTLVLPPQGTVISQTVERYLASIGLPEIRAAYETVALPVGRKLVCLSDALWFISRGVVADELNAGTLITVALSSPMLSGPVGFSVAQSAPINVERSVFSDCLKIAASN